MKVAIVGSGPAGVAAASALVERGIHVDILDFGNEIEQEAEGLASKLCNGNPSQEDLSRLNGSAARESLASTLLSGLRCWLGWTPAFDLMAKRRLGSSFVFRDVEWGVPVEGAAVARSLARGGLSNVWGASCYPLTADDYEKWPIKEPDLRFHYEVAARLLHLIEPLDDLVNIYPHYGSPSAALPLNAPASIVLDHWKRNQVSLAADGIFFGRSRLAVRMEAEENGQGCQLCGLCLYGCPHDAIYRADWTLSSLLRKPFFHYLSPLLVRRYCEHGDRVLVEAVEAKSRNPVQLEYDALFLAAGSLSSLRIAVEAQGYYDQTVRLFDNDLYLVPFLWTTGDKIIPGSLHFGLNELALRVSVHGHPLHVQFYCINNRIRDPFYPLLSLLPPALRHATESLFMRLLLGFIYLPGNVSTNIYCSFRAGSPVATLSLRQQREVQSRNIVREFVRHIAQRRITFGLCPAGPILAGPSGGHLAGALPMKERPGPLQTFADGRLHGTRRVYVVDGSALSTLPAQNSTYTIMANAHRIATLFAEGTSDRIQVGPSASADDTAPPCMSSPKASVRFGQLGVAPYVFEHNHHKVQYEASAYIAAYHDMVLRRAVRMADLRPGMRVLDYGCGQQRLRHALPIGVRYAGYDIVSEFSDIEDPRDSQYDVIFAIQVLMYFDGRSLEDWARALAPLAERLIVMVPARNFLKDEVLDRLCGLNSLRDQMVRLRPADIYQRLLGHFSLNKKRNVFWMGELTSWQRR